MNDTIYALSTPPGNGVAVIRVSGGRAEEAMRACFSRRGAIESHVLYYGAFRHPVTGETLDEGMAVLMRAPRSYTAEDCAEFHCHGSPLVLSRVMAALASIGLRQAEPGEFTRRAFENARLDLSQAEAVMDLIHATAEASAKSALEQLQGAMAKTVTALQDKLTDAIAQLEAAIDYPEEDWEGEIAEGVGEKVRAIRAEIETLLSGGAQGKIVREGLGVALVGRPNAGKSTLLNALLGQDRAIVTDIPGTTRDVIEEGIVVKGLLVRLIDTAGLRESEETVERLGVERTRKAIESADLLLFVIDGAEGMTPEDRAIWEEIGDKPAICLVNKGDKPLLVDEEALAKALGVPVVVTGFGVGLEDLKTAIFAHFSSLAPVAKPPVLVSNRRHLDALADARDAIDCAMDALPLGDMDCVSIDLRRAWQALGSITGLTAEERIVDRIFSTFCLGK